VNNPIAPTLCAAVRKTIERYEMLAPGGGVLVALSGGADSVALLQILLELAGPLSLRVAAAHLNHGLRPDADRDERFCAELAASLGVPFRVGHVPPGTWARVPGGMEQAARRARYEFLAAAAKELGCERVATGHTRDDHVETFLFRLLRGAGRRGLGGIRPVRADGVIRPLIEVGRSELVAFLQERRLRWVEDPTNAEWHLARNRIRHQLVPVLLELQPRAAEHIAACARDLARSAEAEEAIAGELLERYATAGGALCLDRMRHLPPGARVLLLRAWLQRARGGLRGLGRCHFEALAAAREGEEVALPGGQKGVVAQGKLFLHGEAAAWNPPASCFLGCGAEIRFGRWRVCASAPVPWVPGHGLPSTLREAVFDADHVGAGFVVRPWRPGDRVRPLGLGGSRKLSDVFVDRKVARWLRVRWPVVEVQGEIAWVPGLVRGEAARVTEATRRVISVVAEENPMA